MATFEFHDKKDWCTLRDGLAYEVGHSLPPRPSPRPSLTHSPKERVAGGGETSASEAFHRHLANGPECVVNGHEFLSRSGITDKQLWVKRRALDTGAAEVWKVLSILHPRSADTVHRIARLRFALSDTLWSAVGTFYNETHARRSFRDRSQLQRGQAAAARQFLQTRTWLPLALVELAMHHSP